jgi:hypothetical protein
MNIYKTRNDFISTFDQNLIMCEIGVFKGDFSQILFNTSPKELHLIDPFIGSFWSGDKDGLNMQYANLEISYQYLKNLYSNYDYVRIHKGYGQHILQKFSDHYFDFMYIDADHTYDSVKNDLEICKKKTKINGIISGHDYDNNKFPGVVRAVNEFCSKYNLNIFALTQDGCPTFGIINI